MIKFQILIPMRKGVKIASVRSWQTSDVKRFPRPIIPCSILLEADPCQPLQRRLIVIHRTVHNIQDLINIKSGKDKIHIRTVHALVTKLCMQSSDHCHRATFFRALTILQHKVFLPSPAAYVHDISLCLPDCMCRTKSFYLSVIECDFMSFLLQHGRYVFQFQTFVFDDTDEIISCPRYFRMDQQKSKLTPSHVIPPPAAKAL